MFSSLIHPWMLLALLGVGIPILIEFLFRRRRKQVELPTIRFLFKNPEQKKTLRQDRLLLLLRCVVPFVLAWALARPVMNPDWAGRAKTRHAVLVIDSTLSMGQQAGAATAFALAKAKAEELIRLLPRDTPVTILTLGDHLRIEAERSTDLYAVREQVDALQISHGAATLAEALPAIEASLTKGAGPGEAPEVYIFSDFQKTTWLRREAGQTDPVEGLRKLAADTALFLVDVGGSRQFNYDVASLAPREPLIVTDRAADFDAVIRATGKPDKTNATARVTFLVDGEKKGMQEVPLVAGEQAVAFSHRFQKPGEYLVEVSLEGDNDLLDNERYYLASVPEAYRTLILDEGADAPAAGRESRFLRAAIAPVSRPGLDKFSVFDATVIHPSAIARENLDRYFCVLVTGLSRVPDDVAAALSPYVRDGGNLVFFMGPTANVFEYNRQFLGEGRAFLPVELASVQSLPPAAPLFLKPGSESHPLLAALTADKTLTAMPITASATLASVPRGARTVWYFSNGQPALVESDCGRGKVLLFCMPAAPPGNLLPASPGYPVMIQELLRYLAGDPDRGVNLQTGEAFEQDVLTAAEHLILRKPDRTKARLLPQKTAREGVRHISFLQTDRMGKYEIDVPEGMIKRPRFAVNIRSQEGDLDRLEEADLRQMAGPRWGWIRPGETLEDRLQARYSARELTVALIWLLVGVLAMESLLAARFGLRRG